jgi:nitroimidazol reductase NimA-like FMN-containing flavoprotein (pyridoxamine 5'-phosphate oxidase superfamily)
VIAMSVSYLPRHEPAGSSGLDEAGASPRGGWGWPSPPDPGDLSKRVARRRADLHLSQAQVAARAEVNLRYLQYVERYPARPTAAVLRRLAAALQTTPSALLGAGSHQPPRYRRLDGPPLVTTLTPAECHQLIAPGGIGRIAFCTTTGPAMRPVNYAVVAGTIIIRTAQGSTVDGHAGEHVAFEVDHLDQALSQGWSVLIRGRAHRVAHPAELNTIRRDTAIWPWPGGNRDIYVRIIPDTITGRQIETR